MNERFILALSPWFPSARFPDQGDFVLHQVQALRRAGEDIRVLFVDCSWSNSPWTRPALPSMPGDGEVPGSRTTGWFLPRIHYRVWLWWRRRWIRGFRRCVAENGLPALIHAHTYQGAWIAKEIKRLYAIPVVVTEHSGELMAGRLDHLHQRIAREGFEQADCIMAVSSALADAIRKAFGYQEVSILPNVLREDFSWAPPMECPPFVFLFAGGLHPNKGLRLVIDAFQILVREGDHQSELRIAGASEVPEWFASLFRAGSDPGGRIKWLGRIPHDQMLVAFHGSHAVIMASQVETFGMVALEALGCGRPVISTASGGPQDVLGAQNGILVPPNDPEALARAMRQMINEYPRFDSRAISGMAHHQFGEAAFVSGWRALTRNMIIDEA